jgi:hypothetical protein
VIASRLSTEAKLDVLRDSLLGLDPGLAREIEAEDALRGCHSREGFRATVRDRS